MEMMILVDENDKQTGIMEKMETHRRGLLHRAFSGFVFDEDKLLIQQRASGKYHNPNIWANTVCSHPIEGESIVDAVKRRLNEELGFTEDFQEFDSFVYRAECAANGLIEHELDHVCVGKYSGHEIRQNPDEVQNHRWVTRAELEKEISENPDRFSYWLKEILKRNAKDFPWHD